MALPVLGSIGPAAAPWSGVCLCAHMPIQLSGLLTVFLFRAHFGNTGPSEAIDLWQSP